MLLFILSFLVIYFGMHALLFWGLHPLLKGHPALPTLAWVWMGMMIIAPILVRMCDRAGWETLARGLAWVTYSWMGLLFIGFSIFILVGSWELVVHLLKQVNADLARLSIHGPQLAVLATLLMLGGAFYGLYEAGSLKVEVVRLETNKLPSGMDRLRLAQVSDLHLGLLHREEELAPVIARLQQHQPDLLLATGDIVDAQISHLDGLSGLWRQVDPPLGKFAIAGNHEFYAGMTQATEFLQKSGFAMLRNRAEEVTPGVVLIGVDDEAGRRDVPEMELLKKNPKDRLTILLKHRPQVSEGADELFDLQLSGHTHRGQIFPFNLLTGIPYPMQDGLYELTGGGRLYTSRGTGSWGPPMRIGSPPELTIIDLVRP